MKPQTAGSHPNHDNMTDSGLHFQDDALLDNPIWNSLTTSHAPLAVGAQIGRGLARRYPSDIGPLSAFQKQTSEAYEDLAAIVPQADIAVLFLEEPLKLPAGWQLLRDGTLVQMVCTAVPDQLPIIEALVPMETSDLPDMLALAALTEPGPFRERTASLGRFVGIRVKGRLAAMAGRRLCPGNFTEVSAVCTHPDFRGRGYARALVTAVSRNIHDEGRVPFLTSFEANSGAIRIYQQAGFTLRRRFHLAVLKPPISS